MEKKNKYTPYLNKVEREAERLRTKLEKYIKPIVKKEALALKKDMILTQHSLSSGNGQYSDLFETGSRMDKFQNFIYTLNDNHGIVPCFEIVNGKFKWFN